MGLERSPPPKTHYIKMGLKQVLPILALAATCHGAALPEAEHFDMDTVMDLVQEFIANPDPYMEAFGVRAKRHVEDLNRSGFKQFTINHQRGSFLIIESNIAGGMKLDAKQSPNA